MELKFTIEGLDCANCAASLERLLMELEGVKTASINFMTGKMVVEIEENKEKIISAIKKIVEDEEPDATLTEI